MRVCLTIAAIRVAVTAMMGLFMDIYLTDLLLLETTSTGRLSSPIGSLIKSNSFYCIWIISDQNISGGKSTADEDGQRRLLTNQTSEDKVIKYLLANMKNQLPLVMVMGECSR